MAKLRVFQSIENDVYVLIFENDSLALSNQDKDLMQRFGEPEINLGGVFGSSPNNFTLPDEFAKIRSGFPVRKEFDARQAPFDTNTVIKVNSYRDTIVTRFTNALSTLRASSDTFTGEQLYNI